MLHGLKELGYNIGNSQTPIIPVIIGEDYRTVMTWAALIEEGVYTNPVLPPAAPPSSALLRTSYTATQQRHHLETALRAFEIVGQNLDLIPQRDQVTSG
jgi:7-keto-8-aminopelargonate synthetase-like enzyme